MKKNLSTDSILNPDRSFGNTFVQKTKIKKFLPAISEKEWPENWKTVYFKGYARMKEIPLSKSKNLPKVSFDTVLYRRNSFRDFSDRPLTKKQISALLYFSGGMRSYKSPWLANRFYPSGGSRYPLELYVISLNSELPKGLYHYYMKSHSVEKLLSFDHFDVMEYFSQSWVQKASCLILISAVFKRSSVKYNERGFRFAFIEAGHLGQNIYLVSSALSLGCCAIGGYSDDRLDRLLDIDGTSESVIYILALGNKQKINKKSIDKRNKY